MSGAHPIIVQALVRSIEAQRGVKVLYACEAGSRAWGIESAASDYDMRCIYCHPPDWYASIDVEARRDVIELPVTHIRDGLPLDVNGWDLRKALRLLRKSNPPLLEWLHSPIVYHGAEGPAHRTLRAHAGRLFAQRSATYHYLHMARGNFRDYLQGETVWTKKYLYVVRPLLAAHYVSDRGAPPPVDWDALRDATMRHAGAVGEELRKLVGRKREGAPMGPGPRIGVLHDWIVGTLAYLDGVAATLPSPRREQGEPGEGRWEQDGLNTLFRQLVAEAWTETDHA